MNRTPLFTPNPYRDVPAVAERKLWLGEGKSAIMARVELYQTGPGLFEVFTSYAGSVPVRFTGSLGYCINQGELFLTARKAEGYQEQLPSFNADCWIA